MTWAAAALIAAVTLVPVAGAGPAEAKCERALVAGKKVCLKPGHRCRAADQPDYVLAGFSCRKRKLVHASAEELRDGEPYVVEDGEISLPTALAAFDETIAPLPGERAEKGEIGDVEDGTSILQTIGTQLGKLSPAQREVYTEVVTPAADAVVVPPDATRATVRRAPPTVEELQTARIAVADALTVYRRHGFFPAKPIAITLLDNQGTEGPDIAGYVPAESIPHGGLPPVTPNCNVFITRFGRDEPDDEQMVLIFHEVAHCIQQAFYSSYADANRPPQWVIEGAPEWMAGSAAEELGSPAAGILWENWLEKPQIDLEKRDYSAVGFWAMLSQSGLDGWVKIREVLRASVLAGKKAAYTVALIGTSKAFFDRWGPGFVRDPLLGESWDLTGPGIVSSKPKTFALPNGAVRGFTAAPRSARAALLDIKADVLAIRAGPGIRGMIAGTDGHVRTLQQGAYCAKPGGCRCKTNATLELPKIGQGIAKTGFGGDPLKAQFASFAGVSLAKYCKKPSPGPAKDPCTKVAGRQGSCPLPLPGIEVYQLEEGGGFGPLLATFKRGDCTSGGNFVAIATDGEYRLEVGIQDYSGFGPDYVIRSGIPDPEVIVEGPGDTYGNTQFSVPGNPGLGGISFDDAGDMGLGLVPAYNADASAAVSLSGGMDCVYPDEDDE